MRCWRFWEKATQPFGAGPKRRSQRGFTLIELVLAAGYFLIGISGVALYQIAAAKNSASAGDLMMATTLTANEVETLRHTPTPTLVAAGPQILYYDRTGIRQASPSFFAVAYTFVAPAGNVQYTAVTVSTTWFQSPVNPFQHGITMSTYVGSN